MRTNTVGLGEYTNEDLLAELKERNLFSGVTRFEIVGFDERFVIFWDDNAELDLSFQDDNRTLKVFVDERTLPMPR